MKRITALVMTFVFLFSFAACQKEEVSNVVATIASTVFSTAYEISTVTEAESATETSAERSDTKIFSANKTTELTTAVKTTVTELLTSIKTTAEKKTKPSTTRRNYFPSKALTTEKETEKKETAPETSPLTTTRKSSGGIGGPTVPKTSAKNICTISISCSEILGNMGSLKNGKESFVPSDGAILKTVTVEFEQGETVFDVLKRVCAEYSCSDNCKYCQNSGIQLEYEFSPGYNNYYIEGIHQIYEKDCGSKSGWMYKVNGVFPNYGCSDYKVKNGDKIEFVYTLNLGEDIGAEV